MNGKQQWYIVDGCRPSPVPDPSTVYEGQEAAIADACGFGDVKAFYGAFKRIAHTTPGKYRNQQ